MKQTTWSYTTLHQLGIATSSCSGGPSSSSVRSLHNAYIFLRFASFVSICPATSNIAFNTSFVTSPAPAPGLHTDSMRLGYGSDERLRFLCDSDSSAFGAEAEVRE